MKLDQAFENFRRGFEAARVAHAYIIVGMPRVEGKDLAEKILTLVYCSADEKPCGLCRPCEQVVGRTHPDILWVEPQKKSRMISVEQIRDLRRVIVRTSFSGGWKACVIVGADRLGPEASNAFLKTLEEPPGKSIFLLLTESPQFLLPTIISRCQRITLSGDDRINLPGTWRERLMAILKQGGAGNVVTAFAKSDQLIQFLKEIKKSIEAEESEKASDEALNEKADTLDARVNSRYREVRTDIMRFALLWYRDILLLHCGMEDDFVFNDVYLDLKRKKAARLTYRQALDNVRVIEEMNSQLERNLPEPPVLGFGFSLINN